ncbi:hypothetical protein MDAP_000692 [Mitosporidium daphniae]
MKMVPSDTNNPDGHTDALASDTIIDIEFAPQITSEVEPADPSNERPEMETIDPTHEAHTSNAHHTLLSTLHSEQPLEEPTEYHELHLNDSKIKPFFAVDMDELTLAFRKRGIYNEQEKENETFQAPTPVRLVRPLSKIVTLAPGNGSILTPSSSPCETPLASSSFEAPLSSTHDEDKEKLSVIKESLADTKNTMLDNLKSLVERGPELENLQQQSGIKYFC